MSLNKLMLAEITKNLQKATKFKRPKNQWQDPGEITEVNSRNITMRGVNYPVLGVGADGYTQMMQPEMDYEFPQGPVVEYPMMQKGGQHGGLDRWFAEKWVDVKSGKPCGRQEGEKRKGYPACRPSRRVSEDTPKTASELSSSEREKFKRSKTSSKRINYQHRRKEEGGEINETDMANKPNNPSLWSKAKSLAKQKFDVYPSAYANGWAAKWYKSKGGTWRKAEYGMEVPMMKNGGGKPEWLLEAQLKAQGFSGDALAQKLATMAYGGEPQNAGFQALPDYVQNKIMANMAYGGYIPEMMHGGYYMEEGGEPDGGMAIGQIESSIDKLMNLRKFIQPDSDLEPWISSKLTLMDHYTDAVNDYMQYNPEAQEGEEYEEDEMMMMAEGGGIPQRYKNMGFNKVGVKKKSTRPGKKWMVLAKKGDQYKVVHGGYKGMQDFTQHRNEGRRKNFWNRMGGKGSSKATDPFSPLYWHKRFGTWEEGGQVDDVFANGGYVGYDGKRHMSNTPTWSGNVGYQTGGSISDEERAFEEQQMRDAEAYNVAPPQIRIPVEFQETATPAAKKAVRNTGSIVDYLASKGQASDYATRAKLAGSMGIKNYRGTADQNIALLRMLSGSGSTPKITNAKSTTKTNQTPITQKPVSQSPSFVRTNDLIGIKKENANIARAAEQPKKGFKEEVFGASSSDEYIANDPYFFAEESDPDWVKAIDSPFTGLRNAAASVLLDNNLKGAISAGGLLLTGLLSRGLVGKTKTTPYNPKQIGAPTRIPGQKALPGRPIPTGWSTASGLRSSGYPMYAGGGIHINPANKGKFTASAQRAGMGVQEFAQHVMANREDYSPTQVKRANFARNAAKWNKQQGGPVVGDEMDVTPAQLEYLRQMGYEFEMI